MTASVVNLAAVRRAPASKRYRCFYSPIDLNGFPIAMDTGVLPYVDLSASGAEDAQRMAFKKKGCPVSLVERLEERAP